jgi:hypothetical protein
MVVVRPARRVCSAACNAVPAVLWLLPTQAIALIGSRQAAAELSFEMTSRSSCSTCFVLSCMLC